MPIPQRRFGWPPAQRDRDGNYIGRAVRHPVAGPGVIVGIDEIRDNQMIVWLVDFDSIIGKGQMRQLTGTIYPI